MQKLERGLPSPHKTTNETTQNIDSYLPPPAQRQCLMFTATVPRGVREVASMLMGGGDVASVDCVRDEDGPGHKSIKQVRRWLLFFPFDV